LAEEAILAGTSSVLGFRKRVDVESLGTYGYSGLIGAFREVELMRTGVIIWYEIEMS
jgi:hypothetical protein